MRIHLTCPAIGTVWKEAKKGPQLHHQTGPPGRGENPVLRRNLLDNKSGKGGIETLQRMGTGPDRGRSEGI